MYQTKAPTSYAMICTVLDKMAQAATSPVDWRRPMYAAIDELHAQAAPKDRIDAAERISIALLKFDWAIHRKDTEAADKARQQLAELGEAWRAMVEAAPAQLPELVASPQVGSMTEALERISRRGL